jgi:hypothetical protein
MVLVWAQATQRGIWVSNIPSAGTGNALSCAEMAVFLMLATLRRLPLMQAAVRERGLGVPTGETLFGKTVLLLGFGGIAKELAVRCGPVLGVVVMWVGFRCVPACPLGAVSPSRFLCPPVSLFWLHVPARACVCVGMYARTPARMCVRLQACLCVSVYIRMYILDIYILTCR